MLQFEKRTNKMSAVKNQRHPSLCLKSIKQYWSVGIDRHFGALSINTPNNDEIIWFCIGS
jgi:hypothetical protein